MNYIEHKLRDEDIQTVDVFFLYFDKLIIVVAYHLKIVF